MKKIIFLLAVVVMTIAVKAEKYTALCGENEVVHFCGTSEVISVEEDDFYIVVTLANDYRLFAKDTIVEEVSKSVSNSFIRYLSVGDKIDFCLSKYNEIFYVERVRLLGGDDNFFVKRSERKGSARVLRIKDNGVILLSNGLVIRKPKAEHKIGDIVHYRQSGRVMMAKEIKERVQ